MKEKRKGIKPALKTGLKMGEISVLTDGHRDMIRCFLNGDITLGLGCAGTGKTFMAVALALREIFRPESPFSRIILVRSTVPVRGVGFLPGTEQEKCAPYERPFIACVNEIMGRGDAYHVLKDHGAIEFHSTGHEQGLTYRDAIVIIDEAENLCRIKSFFSKKIHGTVVEHKLYAAVIKTLCNTLKLIINNSGNAASVKTAEHDNLVDAVQELRTESSLEHRAHLHFRIRGLFRCIGIKYHITADIARHDDDCILEVNETPLTIGKSSVIEHLKQHIEHIRMRLFNFVEQHNTVRTSAHSLSQLTAIITAYISRRCTDKARHREFFHILRHIDPCKRLFIIEKEIGKRFRKLRFSDTGRTYEQKASERSVRIAQTRSVAADRIRYNLNSLVLSYHALMEHIFKLQIFLFFARQHFGNRYSCPFAHNAGNILFCHFLAEQ